MKKGQEIEELKKKQADQAKQNQAQLKQEKVNMVEQLLGFRIDINQSPF